MVADEHKEKESPDTPSRVWSPHSAALHRRRKIGENSKDKILGSFSNLDLLSSDDDDDGFDNSQDEAGFSSSDSFLKYGGNQSPGRSPGSRRSVKTGLTSSLRESVSKKQEAERELQESLRKLTPEIRAKLAKVFNKEGTPMKERLQIEVDMMRNEEERKTLADFKWKVERRLFNISILESIEAQQELIDRNLAEEAKRAKKEQKEMTKKRQEKIEEEIARKERELDVERQAKLHKAKVIATDAEAHRKDAERTADAALRNKQKKERSIQDREDRIQAFKDGPGKYMSDVEYELKLARMLNSGEL